MNASVKSLRILTLILFAAPWAPGAHGQMLTDPALRADNNAWCLDFGHADTDIDYRIPNAKKHKTFHPTFDEKNTLFVTLERGLCPQGSLYVSAGKLDDVGNSDHKEISGDGHLFALGVKGEFYQQDAAHLGVYAQLSRLNYDFTDGNLPSIAGYPVRYERDLDQTVGTLGLYGAYEAKGFTLSAGPEWIAYESTDYHFRTTFTNNEELFETGVLDMNHEQDLGLRAGLAYAYHRWQLWANLSSGHEDSLTFGVGLKL